MGMDVPLLWFLEVFLLLRLHTVANKNTVNLTEYAMPEVKEARKTNVCKMNMNVYYGRIYIYTMYTMYIYIHIYIYVYYCLHIISNDMNLSTYDKYVYSKYTLTETNSSHLKIGRAPKGNEKVFQPSIFFRCNSLVSGRVTLYSILIVNPIYTLYSGYLFGISLLKGSLGGSNS